MSKRHEERLKESDALLRAKEKQLRNLLEAFKRQMELIHVLKQQKVFIIQARVPDPEKRQTVFFTAPLGGVSCAKVLREGIYGYTGLEAVLSSGGSGGRVTRLALA